jgi:hypothetical protein
MKRIITALILSLCVFAARASITLKIGNDANVTINGQSYPRGYIITTWSQTDSTLRLLYADTRTAVAGTGSNATKFYNYLDGDNGNTPFASYDDLVSWVVANMQPIGGENALLTNISNYTGSVAAQLSEGGNVYNWISNLPGPLSNVQDYTQSTAGSTSSMDSKMSDVVGNLSVVANNSVPANNYRLVSVVGTNKNIVSSGSLRVVKVSAINTNAAKLYIKLYDAANSSQVTVGTTTPAITIEVPAKGTASGIFSYDIVNGLEFNNGIVIATTTGVSDSDNTGVGAGDLYINVMFKTGN